MSEKLTRRSFLKASALLAIAAGVQACAQPAAPTNTPVPPTATTAPAQPTTAPAAATATPAAPTATPKPAEPTATPKPAFSESPMLAELVKAGKLPPVEQRLPNDPMIIKPQDSVGKYGGTWRNVVAGAGDLPGWASRINGAYLLFWEPDGVTVGPQLVSKWEVSGDGKAFTFYLRKGMKWSDGEPFTMADIMYWYEDMALNKEASPSFPGWLTINKEPVKLEKVDDYSFKMSFVQPYGLLLLFMVNNAGMLAYPKHYFQQFHPKYAKKEDLDKAVADAKFETWVQLHGNKNNGNTNPELPVMMPYHVVKPLPDPTPVYDRNPYYWKVDTAGNQLPYIDHIRFTLVENVDLLNMKAIAGEIDASFRGISFTNYTLFKDNEAKGDYKVYDWEVAGTGAVMFPNLSILKDDVLRELFHNLKFRQALSYAIDREEINELRYNGMAGPVQNCFPEKLRAEKELWEPFNYDVDKANALLDEIGLKKAGQWRQRPDGQELALNIGAFATFPNIPEVSELVAGYWRKIGINAGVKPITYDLWWDWVYASEYQVASYYNVSHDGLLQVPYARDVCAVDRSTYWAPNYGYWYATNGAAGEEPPGEIRESQQVFDQLKLEVDPQKAMDLWTDVFRYYIKNMWSIITVGRYPQPMIVKNYMRNVAKVANDGWVTRSPWYVVPEQWWIDQ